MGKNYIGTCPVCQGHNLSIDAASGIFKCWNCDDGHGKVIDWDRQPILNPSQGEGLKAREEQPSGRKTIAAGHASSPYEGELERVSSGELERVSTPLLLGGVGGRLSGGRLPMIPSDYKAVDDAKMEKIGFLQPSDNLPKAYADYLGSIHISLQTLIALGVGISNYSLCYVNRVDGRPVNVKYRSVLKKEFTQESPTKPCAPYNIDCVNPSLTGGEPIDRVIITEGEKDVLSLYEAGYRHVISIANGAQTDVIASFEAFEPWLDRVHSIVICGDSDRPGRELQQHLADHFGGRCSLCTLPAGCKDISDVFVQHGVEAVRTVIEGATLVAQHNLVTIGSLRDDVTARLRGNYDHGYDLGYGPLTDHAFHLTDVGGVIIVTGTPGSGKTDILDDICAHLMVHCHRHVALCSFEMPDKVAHTARYMSLLTGQTDLTQFGDDDLRPFFDTLDEHLCHLTLADDERPTPENVLRAADTLLQTRPLHFLVIDPYLYLDLGLANRESETEGIRRMLVTFQQWARKSHVWVIIVAHPRKLNKTTDGGRLETIDQYTIAGSAHWANIADFILTVGRHLLDNHIPYTEVNVLKVRDQTQCMPGTILYRRQPCGRYDERADLTALRNESLGTLYPTDTEVWL